MADTANISLPLMEAAQSQKHVTHNEALLILDAVVQLSVLTDDLTAPPGGAVDGDRHIVGSGATGAWDDKDLNVAVRLDGAWTFLVPKEGWLCWVQDTGKLKVWISGAWVDFASGAGLVGSSSLDDGTILELGVNTSADSTNRFAVKTNAVLFSHDDVTPGTGDLRITLNKSAAGKDAGFTFQDAFSTRALFGLLGNDDWGVKVSPDGSTFYDALVIDKDTGNVAIGTSSDANNKLLVSGEAMLFTNGGDLRFTFNKGSSSDDVALTFQSGFSARALVGLLGDDDFTFKVTPDGSSFYTSFVIDKDNGQVNFKQLTGHERGYTTVVSNAITVTAGFMNLTGAGPVTLSTINGGFDGAEVTIQHTGGGTLTISNSGNIKTIGATSMTLDNWNDTATFICNGTGTWLCKAFCNNG